MLGERWTGGNGCWLERSGFGKMIPLDGSAGLVGKKDTQFTRS